MRTLFFLVALTAMAVFSAPVWASLPYYNPDIGYTIWLPQGWTEAPSNSLKTDEHMAKPFPVKGMLPEWKAGYTCIADGAGRTLLVEIKPGRKMQEADISNFNRFLVETMRRASVDEPGLPNSPSFHLKDATYFQPQKTLRLETEVVYRGEIRLSLAYIVYTRKGMLTFVGYVDPSDEQAQRVLDQAVLSVYLDDSIRY